jgi:hypothetical protein
VGIQPGRYYFWNTKTRKTTWVRPTAMSAMWSLDGDDADVVREDGKVVIDQSWQTPAEAAKAEAAKADAAKADAAKADAAKADAAKADATMAADEPAADSEYAAFMAELDDKPSDPTADAGAGTGTEEEPGGDDDDDDDAAGGDDDDDEHALVRRLEAERKALQRQLDALRRGEALPEDDGAAAAAAAAPATPAAPPLEPKEKRKKERPCPPGYRRDETGFLVPIVG